MFLFPSSHSSMFHHAQPLGALSCSLDSTMLCEFPQGSLVFYLPSCNVPWPSSPFLLFLLSFSFPYLHLSVLLRVEVDNLCVFHFHVQQCDVRGGYEYTYYSFDDSQCK